MTDNLEQGQGSPPVENGSAGPAEPSRPPMERREFVRAAGLVGAGLAIAGGAVLKDRVIPYSPDPKGEGTRRELPPIPTSPPEAREDVLVRMQHELEDAMAKPMEQRQWVMVIDSRKCIGCHACTIGCVAENKLPPGVVYRPVIIEEHGTYPNVGIRYTPRPCMQCDNPPCVPVCPVHATWKRADGVVPIDYDKCIGCRYCLTGCPYGARTSDFGEHYGAGVAVGAPAGEQQILLGNEPTWEGKPNHEYAKSWSRAGHASPVGNARKCHFCLHRLEVGQLPMCVTTCIGRATYFGDAGDPGSLVSSLISANNAQTLLTHRGTRPRVYYLV
jgi:Fe-S-cluster-containing dehydrogenase component